MSFRETQTFAQLQDLPFSSGVPADGGSEGLVAGASVGRYVILRRVGGGGMGDVYAAYDPELDRRVAVKVLRPGVDSEPARDRLRREAKALARLAHPNVVTVHDVGAHGRRVFIAMEFLSGQTLRCWLAARRRSSGEVLAVFLQAGRGLAAAHSVGLVHQDFKPDNVIVTRDGAVRVLDFGLAEVAARPAPRPVAGTLGYIAPERRAGHLADARSDQYSFCVALYEGLLGELPTGTPLIAETAAYRPTGVLPVWLRRVLRRGLRPEPDARFPSLDALLHALSLGSRRRRRRWLAAAALVVGFPAAAYLKSSVPTVRLCVGADEQAATAWNAAKAAEVRRAFDATEVPFASDAFARVDRQLTHYATNWAAMHTEACRATHVHGKQSERLLDLRMLCLSERLEELRGLAVLLAGADRELVAGAVGAVRGLPGLRECGDLTVMVDSDALPGTPAARAALEASTARLAAQRARDLAAGTIDSEEVDAVIETARKLGYRPLEAQALLFAGRHRGRRPTPGEDLPGVGAEHLLQRAAWTAIAGGDRRTEARSYIELVAQVGHRQRRFEEARQWGRFAAAAISRLRTGGEELRIELETQLGTVSFTEGSPDHREHFARALAGAQATWDADDPRLARHLTNVAMVRGPGRQEATRAVLFLRRAVELKEAAYGPWSPGLGPALINLAALDAGAGRYEEALAGVSRCLEIQRRVYGEHPDMAYPLLLRAQVRIAQDRARQAIEDLETSIRLFETAFGGRHPLTVEAQLTLGEAQLQQRRFAQAGSSLARARQIIDETTDAGHRLRFASQLSRARLELELGRTGSALELARSAETLATGAHFRVEAQQQLLLRLTLGEALSAHGESDRARTELERAVAIGRSADSHLLGEARWALARVLTPLDAAAGQSLAEAARPALCATPVSARTRDRCRRLEEWLEDGTARPVATSRVTR